MRSGCLDLDCKSVELGVTYAPGFKLNPYSAGVDFSRENLTSVDRRQIITTKVDPRTVKVKNSCNGRRHRYSKESERPTYL